jgi:hypothetical protein
MPNATNYVGDSKLRDAPERLDADMTAADIIAILERLRFEQQFAPVWLDKSVRDFLVSSLRRKR